MKQTFLSRRILGGLVFFALIFVTLRVSAFTGSDLTSGQKYYLFNIYQSKFLGADNKLQAPNIGTPLAFTASASGFTIGGTAYTATKNAAGFYQLKNGGNFFAFEDKVDDPDSPTDENRRMYPGGGVLCKNTTNDTDRSYWQLISETEYAEWQAKKKFTVASLNVDGMPKSIALNLVVYKNTFELNPDATEGPGATEIGNRLKESGFDVVSVSEDFNYHSELWNAAWNNGQGVHYNATTHVQVLSQSTADLLNYFSDPKKPLFKTDGQCLFYRDGNVDRDCLMNTETRVAWNDHNGYTDQGADGLITKGFRFYVVRLADGTEIDLYSMHMDADDGQADRDARSSQLRQLVSYIKAHNNGRPIVIIGDSNCRYTRDTVKKDLIDALNEDENYTIRDPWIQFGRNNSYPAYGSGAIMAQTEGYRSGEVVDKIWYVNNKQSNIRLVAETYHQDLSFVASQDVEGTALKQGSPLCDHKPCVVTFSYHTYDPVIDDVAIVETTEEAVYLRNRETGRYLMNGGWWGSHAVVGNYAKPYYVKSLPGGKYTLSSAYGNVNDGAYTDGSSALEFTVLEEEGYKVFTWNDNGTQKALTADDPTYFKDNPLYRYVTYGDLDVKDKLQQWEIVTQAQLAEEMAKATPLNPVNATHLVKSANFDRIDWGGAGWTFDNKGNEILGSYAVTESIGGLDSDPFGNFNRAVSTKKVGTSSKNQWDCYQEVFVPAGYYYITCQGFEKGTECTYFYAWSNPEGSYKEFTQQLARYNSDDFGGGDTQVNAGIAFNEGKYINTLPIIKVGSDGKLIIGVKKTGDNSTEGWQVFDNFQLIYLGTEAPADSYYLYNVESGMFLNGGNAYGTQASVADEGQEWTPQYKSSGVQLLRKDQANGLYVAGNGLYVDGANPAIWHGTGFDNHAFTLAPTNDRENVIGWTSEAKGTVVRDKFIKGERELTDGIHWTAIPQSQYASYKSTAAANKTARLAAVDVYRSAVLDANVDAADFKALWNNPTTTADQITSAAATLKAKIEDEAVVKATAENGYNYSYYINNATCGDDAHTGWTKTGDWGSNTGATHSSNGLVLAPRFYEAWDANALSNRKISQTISNLPAGFYKLALDVNAEKQNDNAAVIGTLLYAKVGTADRVTTVCDTHGDGVIINTFETPIFTVNAGESVEIGLSLENTNANWVAFDNWQLIYCGPYRECHLDDQDNPTKWVLTGTWREVDMAHLVASYDLSTQLLLDATGATFVGKPTIPMADDKPNMMIKVNSADDIANTANVIVGSQCANFVLTDKMDFAPQQSFTASKTLYTRSNTQGYNTVCMPFATKVADYEGCVVYEYTRTNAETITFTQMEDDATIDAGKPVLVYSEGGADWSFDLSSRSVKAVADGQDSEGEGLNGSFLKKTLGESYYKLNSAGTKFVKTTDASTITPFRFYLKTPTNAVKSFSLTFMDDDEETSIDELLNNPSTKVTETYDLNGRRVLHVTRPGIYVKNGKKVVVK